MNLSRLQKEIKKVIIFINKNEIISNNCIRKERNVHIEDSEQFEYSWGERNEILSSRYILCYPII